MQTLTLDLPTPVLLVWGLPEDAELIGRMDDENFSYHSKSKGWGKFPLKNKDWQLIGKLSELTDFKTRKAIKDKGYHIMNPYMMPNSRNYSAKQLENDNSDYWNKYNKWQEAQDKTLPATTLIFFKR